MSVGTLGLRLQHVAVVFVTVGRQRADEVAALMWCRAVWYASVSLGAYK